MHLTTSHEGILWKNTLQASSMLPHLVCISTKQCPTETSESQPHSMICRCACLPALFKANNTCTYIQQPGANVMGSGCTTSCCEHAFVHCCNISKEPVETKHFNMLEHAFVHTSIAKPNNWSNLVLIMPTKKC